MLRTIYAIFLILCLPSWVTAQVNGNTSDPYTSITLEQLRTAIYAGDIDKVEAELSDAQAKFLRGESGLDDLRWLHWAFSKTHPDLIGFIERWLQKYPDSPHAHTAQAWHSRHLSWIIRGGSYVRDTYPEALREFSRLQTKAWDHALIAYELDNRYIPASDALIRLSLTGPNTMKGYNVLDQVMQDDPNWGTLFRGIDTTSPSWGGTWEVAEGMCEYYGPMIESEIDMVLYCKAYAAGEVHTRAKGEWAQGIVREHHFTDLDHIRLKQATSHVSTREQAAFAYNYLSQDGVTNTRMATRFDFSVSQRFNYEFITEAHSRRAIDNARAALEHDPYNPDLINVLIGGVSQFSLPKDGHSIKVTYIERPPREEWIEYSRRLLVIAPYNPEHYSDYAYLKFKDAADFLKDEAFWINSIVYDNHKPERLKSYIHHKHQQIQKMQQMVTGENGEDLQTLAESIDEAEAITCPILRAYRLYYTICQAATMEGCETGSDPSVRYKKILADATERNICISERTTPIHQLVYTPIAIDLSPPQ